MEKKITIAEQYDMVIEKLNTIEGTEALVEFIEDRKAKATKKSTSKADTEKSKANEEIKATILGVIDGKMRATEITKLVNEALGTDYTMNRVQPQLTKCVADGSVVRTEEKKIVYYSLVE